jgi:hypothetical protein
MKIGHRFVFATSTVVAGAIAIALILRPTRTIPPGPELATPEHLSPAIRSVVRSKMKRHGEQLSALVLRVVVLDYDGIARTAGEIFDEPTLARPVVGDELNVALPERYFKLQDTLRAEAKQLVTTAALRNEARVSESLGGLMKTCLACHDLYLHGQGGGQ